MWSKGNLDNGLRNACEIKNNILNFDNLIGNIWYKSFVERYLFKNLVIIKYEYTYLVCVCTVLMRGLHSHRDSRSQDENKSVKGPFVSSSTISTCPRLTSKLSETCRWISPEWKETRISRMSCLIDDSRTRMWMSTFIHTSSSGSYLAKSLKEYRDKNVNQPLGEIDFRKVHYLVIFLFLKLNNCWESS